MKGCALGIALAFGSTLTTAAEVSSLKEAVNLAVLHNPEVNASWYEFEAARAEQRVGQGGYYPKLDFTAQTGKERLRSSGVSDWNYYDPFSANLTLNQMLFDGFATQSEVKRLGNLRQVRFYEFRDASERAALEATRAYLDTLRYQQLVELAKDNYVEHYRAYRDIERRTEAGVSRSVDLEQASGRLALAESNLLTETTNLHDVTARFQRVVGDLPAEMLDEPEFNTSLIPEQRNQAIASAYAENPALQAAMKNIEASKAELEVRRAAMKPRVDLRASLALDEDENGLAQHIHQDGIHLVLSYNLYNGGSDRARNRQYAQKANAAHEQRDKVCRDIRQEVAIAHNDIQSLVLQTGYLDRNQLAIGKARVAYRDQFDIGQRTLLDLLDTENEYFEVQRAYVNAEHDLLVAQARSLASMGRLLAAFSQEAKGVDLDAASDSNAAPCPMELPTGYEIDKDSLIADLLRDRRVRQLDDDSLAFSVRAQFLFGSAELSSDYDRDISDAAEFLNEHPNLSVLIEGHTDAIGSEAFNQNLSERRAQAVYDRLVDKGIKAERLSIVGLGETSPIGDNETESGRDLNRRVDLVFNKSDL